MNNTVKPDFIKDVKEFHTRFNQPYAGPPRRLPPVEEEFRCDFLEEEATEFRVASLEDRPAEMLDALVDIVYVALGTAELHGWNFAQAWKRVHEANMAKEPAKEGSFKIVKPPGWTPPNLDDLVT